ncbi:MAG TPA: antibiotic biosynthesis monooxygenase, partial [Candidatus Acidoferrum sp.]|nr:antibiotic biosynthesis monooxygenase [Candidatus Acidoferrum sp.]
SNWIATLGRTALCLPEFALQSDVRPRAGDGTSMFVALWEFEVKPGCQKRFLKVYGPEGDWATLFRKDANYQETQLFHDPENPAIFLTLDFWASRQAYQTFMTTHAAEYQGLDAAGEELTLRERKIGWFESVDS